MTIRDRLGWSEPVAAERFTASSIRDHGFGFVAVEGDWPNCFATNRLVKDLESRPETVVETDDVFGRWPTWTWANLRGGGVAEFVEWLHLHNETESPGERVEFFVLDVYCLPETPFEV